MRRFISFLMFSLFFSCSNCRSFDGELYITEASEQVYTIKKGDILYAYPKSDVVFVKTNGNTYNYVLSEDKTEQMIGNQKVKFIKQKAFLVITYDDCPASDWNAYQNIHKQYEPVIPAELGLNYLRRALPLEQMREMIADGFEVVNHGTSHHRLERVGLQKAVSKGENKIYGWFVHTFLDGAEITIDDKVYSVLSHGSDSTGNYFQVEPELQKNYYVGTSIQLSENELMKELFYGINDIEKELQIKINHFTYPYTVSDKRTRNMIKESNKYYSCRAYNGYYSDGKTKNLYDPGLNYFPFENNLTLNSA
ncbi:MAG: polysaccharide deacetylase family protein, partial [Clostridia bacterium]|nr:polysaccharide deacetylase family protein [Clostridia bacterium]